MCYFKGSPATKPGTANAGSGASKTSKKPIAPRIRFSHFTRILPGNEVPVVMMQSTLVLGPVPLVNGRPPMRPGDTETVCGAYRAERARRASPCCVRTRDSARAAGRRRCPDMDDRSHHHRCEADDGTGVRPRCWCAADSVAGTGGSVVNRTSRACASRAGRCASDLTRPDVPACACLVAARCTTHVVRRDVAHGDRLSDEGTDRCACVVVWVYPLDVVPLPDAARRFRHLPHLPPCA